MPRLLAAALAATATLLLAGCAATAAPPGASATGAGPGIVTRGVGTVTGTPDRLTIGLGVQTRAPSADAALEDNNTRAAALIEVLRGRGVADADLQTSGLSISPTFGENATITGYEVGNRITATLCDVAGAGALIDAAAQAAGDAVRVDQVSFALDDDGEPRARARAEAVREAQAQAQQLADAAGVTLGPILSITEVSAGAQPPEPFARDQVAAASAVPIEAGSQEIAVTVEVVHAIG